MNTDRNIFINSFANINARNDQNEKKYDYKKDLSNPLPNTSKQDPFESIKFLASQTKPSPSPNLSWNLGSSSNTPKPFEYNSPNNFTALNTSSPSTKNKSSDPFGDLLNFTKTTPDSISVKSNSSCTNINYKDITSNNSTLINPPNTNLPNFQYSKKSSSNLNPAQTAPMQKDSSELWDFDLLKDSKKDTRNDPSTNKTDDLLDFDPILPTKENKIELKFSSGLNSAETNHSKTYNPDMDASKNEDFLLNWDKDDIEDLSEAASHMSIKQSVNDSETDSKLAYLMQFGFSIEQSTDALQISEDNLAEALILLKEQTNFAKAQPKPAQSKYSQMDPNSPSPSSQLYSGSSQNYRSNSIRNDNFFDSFGKKSMTATEKIFESANEVGSNVLRQANTWFDIGKKSLLNKTGLSKRKVSILPDDRYSNSTLKKNSYNSHKPQKYESYQDSDSEKNIDILSSDFSEDDETFYKKLKEKNRAASFEKNQPTHKLEIMAMEPEIDLIGENVSPQLFNKNLPFDLKSKLIGSHTDGNQILSTSTSFNPKSIIPEVPKHLLSQISELKEESNKKFKIGQFEDAYNGYSQAINLMEASKNHPYLIILLNNRSSSLNKIGNFKDSISDLDESIRLCLLYCDRTRIDLGNGDILETNLQHQKALLKRAETKEAMEKYKLALADFDTLASLKIDSTLLQRAKAGSARCSKALGIQRNIPKANQTTSTSLFTNNFAPKPKSTPTYPKMPSENITSNNSINNLQNMASVSPNKIPDDDHFELKESVKNEVFEWKKNKDSIRSLLSSVHFICPSINEIRLSDLIENNRVKIAYMRTISKLHPDKLTSIADLRSKLISQEVFTVLNDAWVIFKNQNNIV
ncbi:UBA domain-containing protein 7 [Smittium culicis]|uniref:UBA domain-containing protein 7 n=1 Tax=Smittium culicis TaxID=133412 RepID=A0A1R1YBT5_9FUNG|nr:UBA domain-containing protein 7 [Smittium culicis]